MELHQHCDKLCTRKLFQQAFLSPSSQALQILNRDVGRFDDYVTPKDFSVYINELVTEDVLDALVSRLQLPADALLYFQVELFRQRLGSKLRRHEWFRYVHPDSEAGSDGEDSEDFSDMNDSDLEYW